MTILVGFVLALFCLAIVIYPLVVTRQRNRLVQLGEDLSQDELELESIRDSIQSLRLDHDLGKVTGQQYEEQLQGYRLAGANALKRQAEAGLAAKEANLEQEILEARAVLVADRLKRGMDDSEATDDQPGA